MLSQFAERRTMSTPECKVKILGILVKRFSWLYQCSVEGPFPETHKTVMKTKYALFQQNCL